jgi:hypothetical protein
MNKPRLEDFIKENPWTDGQGKEHKAAGIDFASYAFALEEYIRELEKKQSSTYPCGKTEMDAKCPDCLDHFEECAKKSRESEGKMADQLVTTEIVKRQDMNEFFINALEKQVPGFEFIKVETWKSAEGWYSQKIIAYKKPSLEDYRKQITRDECGCGRKGLKSLPIEHYNHDGGWPIEGFKEKQWLYVTCPKCGYQWALWKLGVPR